MSLMSFPFSLSQLQCLNNNSRSKKNYKTLEQNHNKLFVFPSKFRYEPREIENEKTLINKTNISR